MRRAVVRRAVTASVAVTALLVAAPASFAKSPSPKPPASGSLAVAFTYPLPHPVLTRYHEPVIAEASDGDVFFASATTIYRIASDGTSVAAKVGDRIYAVAASSSLLVVETPTAVLAYSRTTGKRVADWDVEETGAYAPVLVMGGNVVWSLTDQATDASGLEPATLEELRVGHPASTITDQASPTTPVVDESGDAYFVRFSGRLERVTPTGATHSSSSQAFVTATLAYDDGTLVAELDGGKTVIDEINPTTLSVTSSHSGQLGDFADAAVTTLGVVSLNIPCDTWPCSKSAVRHIALPDTRGPDLSVPNAAVVMGPQPRVLEIPTPSKPQLVGLVLG